MRAIIIGIVSGLIAGWVVTSYGSDANPVEAYKQGRSDALKVKVNGNPNWELEQVCVGMWASKQEVNK